MLNRLGWRLLPEPIDGVWLTWCWKETCFNCHLYVYVDRIRNGLESSIIFLGWLHHHPGLQELLHCFGLPCCKNWIWLQYPWYTSLAGGDTVRWWKLLLMEKMLQELRTGLPSTLTTVTDGTDTTLTYTFKFQITIMILYVFPFVSTRLWRTKSGRIFRK